MNFKLFIAFFLFIGAINAVPTKHYSERTATCSSKCLNHENNLFNEIGSTHHFNYETKSEIELENGQRTQVHLRAKVDVATISKCEHQLQLRKVQIDGPNESEIMKKQLEQHSTKFSQDNGRIESICFDEEELDWVLNLKKSILSTIQVSEREQTEQTLVEKDILGYCNTKYEKISSNQIQKTKFLNTCTKRSQSVNSILTGDFNKQKKSTCKIQLDNQKQLESVVCEEQNTMLPFVQSKASGQIKTTTKLTLDKVEKTLPQLNNKQLIRDSLAFHRNQLNKHNEQESREIVQEIEKILNQIRSNVENNVQKETPEQIRKLSQHLSFLNVQELERLAQQVSNKNDKVQDIFFDTVAQTGTQETAHIILKVILDKQYYKGEISKVRSALWLSMLSNVDQVTDDVLSIVAEHIKKDNLPRQALFALTSMVNEIKDDEQIKQDSRYRQIVNSLIEKLNRSNDEKERIVVLKALQNTGLHSEVFESVLQIAQKQSNKIETRIAAVQALEQHVTEEDRFYKKVLKIFENNSNEAELRIAAFQVLVNNQEKVQELYNILKTESNKQVGSYVVSYFKNARKSQLNEYETLRRIVSTFDLPEKRFERQDFRQSKHIQFTQQIDSLDLATQVEADLIFDEQKQLRNVRARFDLNKENEQVKSVEVTVRQTGLPEVAQQMVQQLTKQMNLNQIVDEIKQFTTIRSKHELNRKINRLVQLLNLNKIDLSGRKLNEEVDASIHVKVEDKTVLYLNMKDIQEYTEKLERHYNQREQIVDQIIEQLTGDNALTLILSNKQHKMPTAHGLPLHSGHGIVIVAGLKNQKDGAFYPSIAFDAHYEMGFTMMNQRPSVHYHFQMHSAPGLKLNVERKNGLPSKLSISMPEDRLQIVSVRSMVKLQTPTGEVELNVSKNERKDCTKSFNKILGVELCHQTTYPRNLIEKNAMNVLLNGQFEFGLHLEKTDSSIRHWEINFETPYNQRSGQGKVLHLAFKTVGSRTDRELSAKVKLQNEGHSKVLYIDLKSPVKSAKIEVSALWTEENMGLKAALIMDDQRFEALIGGEKVNENGEQQYKPIVKLVIPGFRKIHYTGKVAFVNTGKKENFSIELKDAATNKPLIKASAIKSGVIDAKENFKVATDVQAFWFTGSSIRFVSNVDKSSNGISSAIEVIHSSTKQAPTTYKWKMTLNDLSQNQVQKYNADFELNVPQTDFENVAVSWNFVRKIDQEIETELTAFWNNEQNQKTRQVHILQQLKMNKVSAKISSLFENLLKVEIKPLSVHYELQAKTNWQRSQQKYNVQLTARDVHTNKQYKGDMVYQLSQQAPLKMELEAKIQIENNEFKIQHNIDEQEKQQYHGRTLVQLRKGQHIEFNYVYRLKEHSLQVPRLNHELELEAKIPSKQITIKHKSALKLNADQFELKHSLRKNNAVVSDVKVLINRKGQSQLLADNPVFQVKVDGDLSQQNKQINVLLNSKQHQYNHQTKLNFNGKQQLKIDSKTTKNNRQIANVQVDYLKNQKAEAKLQIEKIGDLRIKHQPNSQQFAVVEINSDYYSKPINQKFTIEKNSNKYTIRSKTQQNQQIIGDLDLEIGSTSTLKASVFDWKVSGKAQGKERINLVLENNKNVKEELELELKRQTIKIQFNHLDDKKQTSTVSGQLSIEEESKLQFNNKNKNVELSIKPVGQEKHIRINYDDKRNNIQHKSELRSQDSDLVIVLEHSKDNQNVIKHNTKLSRDNDSYTKTETKKFTIEANYRRKQALEVRFNHENGLNHQTNLEIVDLRNKIAKISSSTNKNGKQIMNVNVDFDTWKKMDVQIAHQQQEKEIKLQMNLKDQQKHISLQTRCSNFEINSKWSKDSSDKDQKLTFEITDKKHDSKYNLLAHHQRKTMLNVKVESLRNGRQQNAELKLHRNGEAYFKLNGQDLKLNTKLDFAHSPVKATVSFESKKHSIQHETTATFLKQENELKIKSKTNKNSKQIVNVDFKINPTTKEIFATGEVYNKNLKIEGNVNRHFEIRLQNQDEQFKHLTELDFNQRTLHSETSKNNQKLHKLDVQMVNRRDIQGSLKIKEHEFEIKTNEYKNQYELNYNNRKMDLISTGYYTINQNLVAAKVSAKLESKQIVDLDTNYRVNERKFDAKLDAFKTKSSIKLDFSQRTQMRANVEFQNQEQNQSINLSIDTTRSEKQITAKVHTKNLTIEKQIKLVNGQELRFNGHFEQNGQSVKADAKITKPFNVNGKINFNTRNLKGQASVETVNNEIKVELFAKDSQGRKVADLKSKLTKSNNKVSVNVDFDSEKLYPYTLDAELTKESEQLVLSSLIKSKQQKVGKFDAKIKVSGWTVDAKVEGDLTISGKRKEILYKLNNLNNKFEHVLKIKKENNYTYGYDIAVHLRQGKFVIHLPNRIVELRYDVTTQTNGHVIVSLDVLPDSQHQPNNIYNVKFDNLITINNQELILNTRTTVHHPEVNHPIDMQFRVEVREPNHQRPLVLFVSYDASSNQQNRLSGLFEILNEQHVRVAHFNISHQNEQILDIHYRFAMNTQLVHQQLTWSILNKNTQKQTGELLGQINLKQNIAKIELNNKHKLQINWQMNFDKNVIIQIRAQTDNLVRKVKIVSNNKQLEITNYENEKIKSNYIVSLLKVENTLLAIEMHKKQNGKLEKVAFIQLVKDSLNYAKVHLKVEKSLVYEIESSVNNVENKIRSVVKRHEKEIKQIVKQQYQNMKQEQSENTSKLIRKASEDLENVLSDYQNLLREYLPNVLDTVNNVYQKISQHFKQVWNVNLEVTINEFVSDLSEKINYVERNVQHLIRKIEEQSRKIKRQFNEIKEKFDHEVIAKLSAQLEDNLNDVIEFAEREGEQVYELLYKVSKNLKLNNVAQKIRSMIVAIKNQIKQTQVHDNLHKLVYNNYQNKFQAKWQPKEGEAYIKVYFPTTLLNKWSN